MNFDCYQYEPSSDTWVKSATSTYYHYTSAYTHHDQLGLVISGSHDGAGMNKVLSIPDGQTVQVFTEDWFISSWHRYSSDWLIGKITLDNFILCYQVFEFNTN